MKQLKAILELLPRRTFAVLFACLFMLQGMGVFHAAMAQNKQSQEFSIGSTAAGEANLAAKSAHCDKLFNDAGPMSGHCSHIGFCPLCSLAGTHSVSFLKLSNANIIQVISMRSLAVAPLIEEIDPALLQTSVGIERTYSIIAPPSV